MTDCSLWHNVDRNLCGEQLENKKWLPEAIQALQRIKSFKRKEIFLVSILYSFLACLDSLCALLSMINNGENQGKKTCFSFLTVFSSLYLLYLISRVMNNVEVKQGQVETCGLGHRLSGAVTFDISCFIKLNLLCESSHTDTGAIHFKVQATDRPSLLCCQNYDNENES